MNIPHYASGVFLIDFEFRSENGVEGNHSTPFCCVTRQWPSGHTDRYWQDELQSMTDAPFPTDPDALTVAYYASAEMGCFRALGWNMPVNLLDLFAEFRCLTNGQHPPHGNGLVGALLYFGLDGISVEEKTEMRDLILSGGPWTADQQEAILDYCETDVVALDKLLTVMQSKIDWPRALLRGAYMQAAAQIEYQGVPLDHELFETVDSVWLDIQGALISRIDQDYGVYENGSFRAKRFEDYLDQNGIPWPRHPSGALDLRAETFADMAHHYPAVAPMQQLRAMLAELRLSKVSVGDDGRNRCLLSAFRAKTGRNQPSTSRFIFGPSRWMRGFIKPPCGYGLAYVDWGQQEHGIAGALSNDKAMLHAYKSGDPYLEFAKQAGSVPANATKQSHGVEREQFKACVLAVQYGMGAESLAIRIGQPVAKARELLALHRRAYARFWEWSDAVVNQAALGGSLRTVFGWRYQARGFLNERSLRNFPMQAHGAEMLRIACILLTRRDVAVCAPVHDALLIEAPLEKLDAVVAETQALMAEASRIVLGGFELSSDANLVRYPERYMDPAGVTMWNIVMDLVDRQDQRVTPL